MVSLGKKARSLCSKFLLIICKRETTKMPGKENVYFTKIQIQRLCELYQDMDNLWNITSPDYHKRDKKNESLEKIKGVLVEEFQDIQPFTVGQLWEKLANLRSYYCKELKKVTDSKKSGAGTDEVYTSKWCHFNDLDSFLRTQVIPRRSSTNIDNSVRGEAGSDDDDNDDDEGNNSDDSAGSGDTSVTSVSQPSSQTPRRSSQTPRRMLAGTKRKLSRPEAVMEQACTVLSRISAIPRSAPQPVIQDDDDDIFGKHVAREMKKIKNERAKSLARCRIQAILFEAQYDEPVPARIPSGNFQTGTQSRVISSQNEPYEPFHRTGAARDAMSSRDDPMEIYRQTVYSM